MKTKKLHLMASAALLAFASCTNDMQELDSEQSQLLKQIVMTTQDFQPEAGSRTVYQIAEGAVKCTWASNDTVGVFPDEGAQAYFPMASGAGTKNASFDGKGWALKDGYTYASYYPYIGKAYLDRNAVPVSYTGQTQVGNASMEHLGGYDYMVATPTAPEFGSAKFTFKHISALVQLKLTIPQPATLTSVKLVTDTKAFAVEGKINIMAETPGITPVTSASDVKLDLKDIKTTEANQVVTLYMMLPPADLSGQTLKAVVVSDKGTQDIALETRNFKAGTAYALSGEMENTDLGYKDGVIRMAEAGTMAQLLGDNLLEITSLKVMGPINGTDVRCLRQMLGGSEYSDAEKGKLTSLDLSEATIIKGGRSYYYSSPTYYYTSNDVIGDYMFYKCGNLQDITLPASVISIGERTFYSCSSLTSIDIPDSVTSIDQHAFYGCNMLSSIDIPDGVNSIGNHAFVNCSSLISIKIPNKVTEIGDFTFSACSSLTAVQIGNGVTSIGDYAFQNCYDLASVEKGDAVTLIGDNAFKNCSSLISAPIGKNITSIGSNAFIGCSSLTSIDIPDSVTSIGSSAFEGCSSLISVTMGNGVRTIDGMAFKNCPSLTSVYITDLAAWCNITFAVSSSNPLNGSAKLYLNNNELNELTIPSGVKRIKDYVFYNCSSLTSIDIPDDVISIGEWAFYFCTSLTSIDIPDSVTSIGMYAFYNCSSLTSVDIPASLASIGEYAFFSCPALTSVYITDLAAWCNITFESSSANPLNRGAKLYLNNNELTELTIPSEINQIMDYVFYGCKGLKKVTIGDGITSIGFAAFSSCSSLTSVHITDLSAWCNITFESYSSNPLNGGAKLYLNNNELTELVIPAALTKIKDFTFYGCQSISKITMGEQVTSVGSRSFRNCSSLAQVYCQGTTPPTINPSSTNSSFSGSGSSRTLYVPKGYSSAYQSSSWASFFESIQEME